MEKSTFVSRGVSRGKKNIVLENELPVELRHKRVNAFVELNEE